MTLDTVGTETPACSAIWAIVAVVAGGRTFGPTAGAAMSGECTESFDACSSEFCEEQDARPFDEHAGCNRENTLDGPGWCLWFARRNQSQSTIETFGQPGGVATGRPWTDRGGAFTASRRTLTIWSRMRGGRVVSIRWRSMVILAVLALVIAACSSSTSSEHRSIGRAAFGGPVHGSIRRPVGGGRAGDDRLVAHRDRQGRQG